MPGRDTIFVNGGIYHIFNKTVDKRKIFISKRYVDIFIKILKYYRSNHAKVSFSRMSSLPESVQIQINNQIQFKNSFRINVLAYCLMPTHFHLLFQQKVSGGVQKIMSDLINSFTRYYNKSVQRIGPVYLPRFKAVEIQTDAQLMHVSRYIHLNPYSSKLITQKESIASYPYSSYSQYIKNRSDGLINNDKVMELFDYDLKKYEDFVIKNADYQQTLERVKYVYKW